MKLNPKIYVFLLLLVFTVGAFVVGRFTKTCIECDVECPKCDDCPEITTEMCAEMFECPDVTIPECPECPECPDCDCKCEECDCSDSDSDNGTGDSDGEEFKESPCEDLSLERCFYRKNNYNDCKWEGDLHTGNCVPI